MISDLLTGTLAEEIAANRQLRIYVPTTPATRVAALASRELSGSRLALVNGFTDFDAGQREEAAGIFTLLRRGLLGVAISPIQLDAAGRTNLSGIGTPGRPKAAMIGFRGLTENNDTPCPLWYVMAAHSPRALVGRVDIVCGAAPSGLGQRTLMTPAGCFDLVDGGFHARWITSGGRELIAGAPDFPIAVADDVEVRDALAAATLAALERVDPDGSRRREFGE